MLFNGCYAFEGSNFYDKDIKTSRLNQPMVQEIHLNCSDVTRLCLSDCNGAKKKKGEPWSHVRLFGAISKGYQDSKFHWTHRSFWSKRRKGDKGAGGPTGPPVTTKQLYITSPSYSLLLDVHNSGYHVASGMSTITQGTITALCPSGEVFLPGATAHCTPVISIPALQCILNSTDTIKVNGLVESTSSGVKYAFRNITILCFYGLNSTNATCVQITPNDTQWAQLQHIVGELQNISGGYLGVVSGGQIFKFNQTILCCSNLSGVYNEDVEMHELWVISDLGIEVLTYIGCSLSIISSCCLLITYAIFKELRKVGDEPVSFHSSI